MKKPKPKARAVKKSKLPSPGPRLLRKIAEARLGGRGTAPETGATDPETRRLVSELEVHQLELEMQNEELRAARVEIEAGLARYTELFDFAPLGYAVVDSRGAILEINHAGARLLRLDRAHLLGMRFGRFLRPHERAAFVDFLCGAVVTERRQSAELEIAVSDGATLHFALTAVARVDEEETILLQFEDITERKARDEALARAEKALRETDRRKDVFLATLAHELRNPLAPIRTSLASLTRHAVSDERSRKAFGILDRQVAHLARLVDDLLDVTRINRAKIELQRRHSDLSELVRSTLEDHSASFEASEIRVEVGIDQADFSLDADPVRLVQVVSNLLSNAEKFTPRGGSVTVTLRRERGSAVLRVSDSGAGMAPETLAHVFEPFAQAPQTIDRARGGLGLGLAMVKGLVELHGGTVSLRSDGEGRGAEVTVILPLDEEPPDTRPPPPKHPSSPRARRVLVIEDNRDAAESMVELLEDVGHEVRLALDGMSGIQTARAFLPEVVICDIGLPEMTGYDVAKALRDVETLKRTFLISLSGYSRAEDRRLAHDAGFDQHMVKPPDIDELYRLIVEGPESKSPATLMAHSEPH